MTKDLTEAWKNGGLKKDKKYYTKDKLGRTYIKTYNKKGFKGLVEEVLCEVPSYEKYKCLETGIILADSLIKSTQEENAKLKELLGQASYHLIGYRNNDTLPERAFYEEEISEFLEKIDEVLDVAED